MRGSLRNVGQAMRIFVPFLPMLLPGLIFIGLILTIFALFTALLVIKGGGTGGSFDRCVSNVGFVGGGVPKELVSVYREAAARYRLGGEGPAWLAAVNDQETTFGTNLNLSSAGAVGWMQFMPDTWARYGVDANQDGKKDPYNPQDAIFSAANYLKASGAPANWRQAIWSYNHADWYVAQVQAKKNRYLAPTGRGGGDDGVAWAAGDSTSGSCNAPEGALSQGSPNGARLLSNPKVKFLRETQREDVRSGRISPRLIALLNAISTNHRISISALASDHSPGTNHQAGRAADLAIVDGEVCNAHLHGRSGRCWQLAQELDRVQGCLHPTELIYLYDPGPSLDSFSRPDHYNHVHVGYDGPLGNHQYPPAAPACSPLTITGSRR